MFYNEVGQFKTSYRADQALFPIRQDLIALGVFLIFLYAVVPFTFNNFWLNTVVIPTLIFGVATIGLNILTGYAGQLSFGTGAFMGVGAYTAFKLTTYFPEINIVILILTSGVTSAAIGLFFGIPSLRIKGLYLAVATLAAQFFLEWVFIQMHWLNNYSESGAIVAPTRTLFGVAITGPSATASARYLVVLSIVVLLTWIAANLVRGRFGRSWRAVRDMDIAAELIGISLFGAKLRAFAVSSFYCGVSGAMLVFFLYGAAEPNVFDINRSFSILFMVIIGGLGSIYGSFLGAAFIWNLPIIIRLIPLALGLRVEPVYTEFLTSMIEGALIISVLIVEPRGFARLWQIAREKLRLWPFPY